MAKNGSKIHNFESILSKFSRGYVPGTLVRLRVYKQKCLIFMTKNGSKRHNFEVIFAIFPRGHAPRPPSMSRGLQAKF